MTASAATFLLAAAVLVAATRPGAARLHAITATGEEPTTPPSVRPLWCAVGGTAAGALGWAATGSTTAGVLTAAVGVGLGLILRRLADRPRRSDDDPVDLAGAWEQLAVCLEVGLPVAAAVAAAADALDGRTGAELRRVAGLLELGADPAQAWRAAENASGPSSLGQDGSGLAAFARAAARSAGTGAALARTARTEEQRIRAALVDTAEARAQRAGVLITAPLGLCFLPAFLVLGIAPVVIGLAGEVLARW
jgi:pilus assembly protein TadC